MDVPPGGPVDDVEPAVLAQALGAELEKGEWVLCARFVRLTRGRLLGSAGQGGGSHILVVTDRRVIRVTGRAGGRISDLLNDGSTQDEAAWMWPQGTPLTKGYLTHRSVWLAQIRDAERRWYWGRDRWLALRTSDGREQGVSGRAEAIVALEAAIRHALEGPGRWSIPPPCLPSTMSWRQRLAAVLRPN